MDARGSQPVGPRQRGGCLPERPKAARGGRPKRSPLGGVRCSAPLLPGQSSGSRLSQTTSLQRTMAPELVSGRWGGGARTARPSGLGRTAASREKGRIHSLPEGHNLGGSCCGREEPASSTRALPFNPSYPGPEGQAVRPGSGPLTPRRPSDCVRYLSWAAWRYRSSEAP